MTIMDNHHYAMELADKADRAKRLRQKEKAKGFFREAFEHESLAALKLQDRLGIEPTRSILFRSAASLALECEEFLEAERMVAYGLSGYPSNEVAEELRDLLEKINFERHLRLRGISLDPNELQLSIWGPAIGLGFAQSREFRERVEKIETLSLRTLERKLERPFRESGRPSKEIAEVFEVYISVPRAASFAVTLRLASDETSLPGIDLGEDVVTEIIECVELINERKESQLKKRIGNTAYYDNFVSISKQLFPDGKKVSNVGLTHKQNGEEKRVTLKRKKSEWNPITESQDLRDDDEPLEIYGTLRFADATKKRQGIIELVDAQNAIHKVKVPLGMMADIVRPMFDYDVVVKGKRNNRGDVILVDIERQNEEQ